MKISIFGLGYVGVVTSAILSRNNNIIGVDINPTKVDMINQGTSPIIEEKVNELIKQGITNNNLKATTDAKEAILATDISIICVGTPSKEDGSHDLTYLDKVLKEISDILKEKQEYHLIIIRSTSPPGTTEEMIQKYFNNPNVGVCFNPEFLREGVAVKDYLNPPFIIIACNDEKGKELMKEFYKDINAEFIITSFKEAEILKVLCNVFHTLKIVFGNEVGRFCEAYNIDGKRVMELICKDKKLNISEKYLTPGFAYGGSCLPKDLRSFKYLSKIKNTEIPMISNIETSNEAHIQDVIKKIESCKIKDISFIGLSFKSGTDDLRESPTVKLVEYFIGKGYNIKIYDPYVELSKLIGSNKRYIEKEIPHISQLLCSSLEETFKNNLIVITRDEDFEKHITEKHQIIDLR